MGPRSNSVGEWNETYGTISYTTPLPPQQAELLPPNQRLKPVVLEGLLRHEELVPFPIRALPDLAHRLGLDSALKRLSSTHTDCGAAGSRAPSKQAQTGAKLLPKMQGWRTLFRGESTNQGPTQANTRFE